jgi:hypothetical protein
VKRVAVGLALSLMVTSAVGQSLELSKERPAYDYELLRSVPDAVSQPADRKIISEFLDDKGSARAAFEARIHAACPEFVGGQMTVMEFATHLDREAAMLDRELWAAYERMIDRLSPQGRSELQRAPGLATVMSADAKAVAIAQAAPSVAESSFFRVCKEAGWTPQTEDSPRLE